MNRRLAQCSASGCERPVHARGLCEKHYKCYRRSSEYIPSSRPSPMDRIHALVVVTEAGCWEYGGIPNAYGYGTIHADGRTQMVHRYVYEQQEAGIPVGLTLDHLCRNRLCCNPQHLEPVTGAENTLRSPTNLFAVNARKTHCIHGHGFTPENTYRYANGRRQCRTCARHKAADRRARLRGKEAS